MATARSKLPATARAVTASAFRIRLHKHRRCFRRASKNANKLILLDDTSLDCESLTRMHQQQLDRPNDIGTEVIC